MLESVTEDHKLTGSSPHCFKSTFLGINQVPGTVFFPVFMYGHESWTIKKAV